jgi:heat shock protein HslJ
MEVLLMLRTLWIAVACAAASIPVTASAAAAGASHTIPAAARAPSPAADGRAFRATGNEPGWRLDIGPTEMSLLTNFGQTRLIAATPAAQVSNVTTKYVARTGQGELTVTIGDRLCVDSMSGMPHPQTVTVVTGGQTLTGCGGEPASLLQGAEWTVEAIADMSLVPGSQVTLAFAPDGRLSGQAPCNRFTGEYTLTGEGLAIDAAAGTRMTCTAPLMEQERAFLAALGGTQGFSISADGALLLRTGDGRTIHARR